MKTSFYENRRSASNTIVLIVLLFDSTLSVFPQAGPPQAGRPGASLNAARAPAVATRRAKLMEIHKDAVIIIPSQYKARDGGMRDNLNFLYLTGLKEPDAILVLDPGGSPRETLCRRASGGPGARGGTGGGMTGMGGSENAAVPRPAAFLGLYRTDFHREVRQEEGRSSSSSTPLTRRKKWSGF